MLEKIDRRIKSISPPKYYPFDKKKKQESFGTYIPAGTMYSPMAYGLENMEK